ncbi:MAG: M28 family peptidase [Methanomassiliicoccales archaeon]|nr:M28 family peptidase [Methanomassiliicoccales archaeon]
MYDVIGVDSKKPIVIALTIVLFTGAMPALGIDGSTDSVVFLLDDSSITSFESGMLDRIDGMTAWTYDEALEGISVSHRAFRSAGSAGANATSTWIEGMFSGFGLETWTEPFEFATWDLLGRPELTVDIDGDVATNSDRTSLESFQSEHFSWPTPDGGFLAEAVVLPLPSVPDRASMGSAAIDDEDWAGLNTTDKIVFVGREVRWNGDWGQKFFQKIAVETPVAVVFIWWYDWMNGFPPAYYPSTGGRPLGTMANTFWSLGVSTGSVNFTESMLIKSALPDNDASAFISIPSSIALGSHRNVIGRLQGHAAPERMILVTGHYDTVMDPGFCDNGAGVAGVLEIANMTAEAMSEDLYRPKYTILFVAFAAEELGMVGSVNFVKAHLAELKNIVAVLNIDCIGSDELKVTMTESSSGLDMDEIVLDAAEDLGVVASIEGPGGSDQESFRDPIGSEGTYSHNWDKAASISGARPVMASAMVSSSPIIYSDIWTLGTPGWIHTSHDSSFSIGGTAWIDEQNLEDHIRVSALTLLRLSPDVRENGDDDSAIAYLIVGVVLAVAVLAVTAVIFFGRRQ